MTIRLTVDAIVTRVPRFNSQGKDLRGAVYFLAPTLMNAEYPIAARPMFPMTSANGAGFFFLPKVDDEIEIEVNVDDPNHPYDNYHVFKRDPRYRASLYSDVTEINSEFLESYGQRMGWSDRNGNILVFDEDDINPFAKLSSALGKALIEGSGAKAQFNRLKVAIGTDAVELLLEIKETLTELKNQQDSINLITVPTALGLSGTPTNAASFIAHKAQFTIKETKVESIRGEFE